MKILKSKRPKKPTVSNLLEVWIACICVTFLCCNNVSGAGFPSCSGFQKVGVSFLNKDTGNFAYEIYPYQWYKLHTLRSRHAIKKSLEEEQLQKERVATHNKQEQRLAEVERFMRTVKKVLISNTMVNHQLSPALSKDDWINDAAVDTNI